MRVYVASEQRFVEHHGQLYVDGVAHYDFWRRYLDVFDEVTIIARARPVDIVPAGWLPATGECVDYYSMPYYEGPAGFARLAVPYLKAARQVAKQPGAFILRVPGVTGNALWLNLRQMQKPFALEVVGDPYDALSPWVWRMWWIRPVRWGAVQMLRLECRTALGGIAYVTHESLQRRYPPAARVKPYDGQIGVKVYGISDVQLANGVIPIDPCVFMEGDDQPWRLIYVGSLAALYKGQEVLLKAVSQCVHEGQNIELVMIGGGRYQAHLENLARQLGIDDRVQWRGHISDANQLFAGLQQAHLFILPSFTEGLPRAMIEAMAHGLPCVGTAVGGIPELLLNEDLVPVGDVPALARKINEVLADPVRMARMSQRNLAVAQEYRAEDLRARRVEFYQHVRAFTTAWVAGQL
jgi:glycosyltransferase involved in cell wall biosynthesis